MTRWLGPVLGAALTAMPAVASAQAPDEEDVLVEDDAEQREERAPAADPAFVEGPSELVAPPVEVEADDGPLSWSVLLSTRVIMRENQDLRPIDDSTRQSILDTDDRQDFGHTDILTTLAYKPVDPVVFNLRLKYDAIWANEQLGQTTGSTGDINVYDLNIDAAVFEAGPAALSVKIGRQAFTIGGVPRDYMLAGTLDAITAQLELGPAGRLRILALDYFGGNDLPVVGFQAYREGLARTEGFDGDNYTLRSGAIYEIDDAAMPGLPIEARAYWFYASIGAGPIERSGADITRGGLNGNYSDGDYQHMMGLRAAFVHDFEAGGHLRVYGEYARSAGIDRKPEEARDVDTGGNAFGGGVDLEWAASEAITLIAGGEFYHFDGATYASDGLEFERGFVGFQGARIGGTTLGRHSAWRPASHVGPAGVVHHPHDQKRVAGTQFGFARLGVDVHGTRLTADLWLLQDTGSSFLDIDGIDDLPEPPFGYTREEFRAQARLGKSLGRAIDLRLVQPFAEIVRAEVGYAVFMPGDYYGVEVSRLAGDEDTALGGDETFWVIDFGASVTF